MNVISSCFNCGRNPTDFTPILLLIPFAARNTSRDDIKGEFPAFSESVVCRLYFSRKVTRTSSSFLPDIMKSLMSLAIV
ncbi:hypothetical protein EB796_017831 [Bugula neritina]|uniref:Uncharacterized protein n=1 Tax=Bugula neritina TaxID=10212 RepID=A0A7J7JC79_BUGNE|nr:hypothetical protein EB796_017831 [Bugula neritina]